MTEKSTYEELQKRIQELEQENRFYRLIAGDSADMISKHDPGGVYLYASPACQAVLGYTPDELIGQNAYDLFHPDDHVPIRKNYQEIMEKEVIDRVSYRMRHKHGHYIRVETTSWAIRNPKTNEIDEIIATTRDNTNRNRAESLLESQNRIMSTLLDNLQVGVFMVEAPSGKPMLANKRALELLGRGIMNGAEKNTLAEIYQAYRYGTEDLYPPDQMPIVRAMAGESKIIDDMVVVRPDGTEVLLEVFGSPVKDKQGNVTAGLVSFIDITEQKKSEETLKREKEKFRVLVEESPLGVSLIRKDGKYEYINPKFTELFGYILEEIATGKDWFVKAFPDTEYREEVISQWMGDIRNSQIGEARPREFKIRCKDNTEKNIHFRPVTMENGDQFAIYEDVTDQKQMEAQLLQAQKMEAIGTLAGGIAHDFNNSMQAILGYTQILLIDKPEDMPEFKKLRQIQASALRASELTQQLLTFSRKVESKLRPLNLNQEVQQVEKLLRRTIPKMVDIKIHLEKNLNIINADAAQIEQVIMNLGINARDAMPDGGELIIETENVFLDEEYCRSHFEAEAGEYVLLSVSDTGIGMDKETLKHIFEPFYTSKEPGKGTGLGLAMVYGIVRSHGSHIMCYSEPGKGTIFRLYFPVIQEDLLRPIESLEEAEFKRGTETVLVVDDEEAIREFAEEILRRFGYTVLIAEDGEKALDVYRNKKENISLVILDLIMPGMGGKKCMEEILKIDPSQKMIIASGYSAKDRVEEPLKSSAKGYIKKPYELGPMLTVIREVLDQE